MSTGLGKHKYVDDGESGAYHEAKAICPYCECNHCEADFADVGIGLVQCGPYYCPNCKASEASTIDNRELSEKEKETGWYQPGSEISENIPQINNVPIGHKNGESLYKLGINTIPSSK